MNSSQNAPSAPRTGDAQGSGSKNPFLAIGLFIRQVIAELRKVVWPTREEATRTTWVVVIVVIILSLILAAFDFGIQKVIELFLNFGR